MGVRGKIEAWLVLGWQVVGQLRKIGAFVSEGQRVVAFLLLFVQLLLGRLDNRLDYRLPFAFLVLDEIVEVTIVLLPEVVHFSLVLLIYDLASLVLGCDLRCLLLNEFGVELAKVSDYRVDLRRFLVRICSSHSLRLVNWSFYLCSWD